MPGVLIYMAHADRALSSPPLRSASFPGAAPQISHTTKRYQLPMIRITSRPAIGGEPWMPRAVRRLSARPNGEPIWRVIVPPIRRLLTLGACIQAFSNWLTVCLVLLRGPAARRHDAVMVTRSGLHLRAPACAAALWPTIEVFALHAYRLSAFDLSGMHILDVGAHVGSFAVAACARYPGTTVAAYEPTPETFRYLVRNIEHNGFNARITAHNVAVTGGSGAAYLTTGDRADSTNVVSHVATPGTISVPSLTLDAAMRSGGRAVEVCKFDCEGGEYELLRLVEARTLSGVRYIFLEYHPMPGYSWDVIASRLVPLGFRLLRREEYLSSGMAWLAR